jgi:hypothetical protein
MPSEIITSAQTFDSTGIAFGISGVRIAQNRALIDARLDIVLSPDAALGLSSPASSLRTPGQSP